jgi:hypothetical protein
MKKKKANSTKFEFSKSIKMKSFEKKPTNGGIPAIESREITKSLVDTCVPLKWVKEYNVLRFVNESWKSVVKSTNNARLYMKTYDQSSNTVVVASWDKITF